MEDEKEKSIARSLETKTDMLEFMPKLLEDLWEMGCSMQSILALVRSLDLKGDKIRILDLGCGKGAIALTLAEEFGFSALGIDACEEFLNVARQKISGMGLEKKCSFENGDIREFVKTSADYDLVIYASLGNVLGNFSQIVANLRNVVKLGGHIIIDDGYLKNGESVNRSGYEHYTSHDSTIGQLLQHGDKLISEMSTEEETSEINYEYLSLIKNRGQEIIKEDPNAKNMINEYIRGQEDECKFIDENVSGAAWLIQKT